jgi:1-acyl-sn-glycerol-3-phosphate acyltransferase
MSGEELHVPAGHTKGEVMSLGQRVMYAVCRAAIHGVCRVWFRLEIVGRENLPAEGAYIVSPIHRSNLDTPVLSAITTRRLRYMGKESLWRSRALGWLLTALGGFPVQRGTADREALKAGLACIERGEPLVMFPEGTRQVGPEVAEMFDGPAYVACRTLTPIVPIGMGGTERAMPKGAKFIRPVKMTIVIGPALVPPPLKESGRVSRKAVRDLTAELGETIQGLFDQAQELAGHPNPPRSAPIEVEVLDELPPEALDEPGDQPTE